MPISFMEVGARRKIKAITGNDAVRKHLGSLGFTEGVDVEIVAAMGGNLIIGIMGSRVAVDQGLAKRILV